MATKSRKSSGPVLRSLSPSGRFCSHGHPSMSNSSSGFASYTSSSFSSPSSAFFNPHQSNRAASPTRVNLYNSSQMTQSFRCSINSRSGSPSRSITVSKQRNQLISAPRKTCMCSPTTHPGSFRCSLHKNMHNNNHGNSSAPFQSNRLNMLRSAMKNSVVRIGGVEGEWVKRALTALIRPSSHQQRRRSSFQSRPSRLSAMSKADDL